MTDTLIHITVEYSNAVLIAVMPHISDFAAKMELPIPQPITVSQIARAHVVSHTWLLSTGIWLTNGYWFLFQSHGGDPLQGLVAAFSTPTNWFREQEFNDEDIPKYFGLSHMTANNAIAMARTTLLKLGFTPRITHADQPPDWVDGPSDSKRFKAHIPYCQVQWEWPAEKVPHFVKEHTTVRVQINTETKTVVGIDCVFGANDKPPLVYVKLSVEPELEADFQRRTRQNMFTDTNAPPRQP